MTLRVIFDISVAWSDVGFAPNNDQTRDPARRAKDEPTTSPEGRSRDRQDRAIVKTRLWFCSS